MGFRPTDAAARGRRRRFGTRARRLEAVAAGLEAPSMSMLGAASRSFMPQKEAPPRGNGGTSGQSGRFVDLGNHGGASGVAFSGAEGVAAASCVVCSGDP